MLVILGLTIVPNSQIIIFIQENKSQFHSLRDANMVALKTVVLVKSLLLCSFFDTKSIIRTFFRKFSESNNLKIMWNIKEIL